MNPSKSSNQYTIWRPSEFMAWEPTNPSKSSNHQHPRVEVDMDRLVLVVHGLYPYEIDLEQCTNPARLLDSVLQVSGKLWCDRQLAGELLAAVETACWLRFNNDSQGVFCPYGRPMQVNWKASRTNR